MNGLKQTQEYLQSLKTLNWTLAGKTLGQRFWEDRLSLVASSLTFTTSIALVPLLAIALAVMSAHPFFANMQQLLQQWLIDSLIPPPIAKQVMQYVTQFTTKAHRLGWAGFAVLLISAFALVLTIDQTLNRIWRAEQPFSLARLAKRWGLYVALLVLGPLLLAGSLTLTTYAVMYSKMYVGAKGVSLAYSVLEFLLVWGGLFALYRYVPQALVLRRHALMGAFLAAAGLEIAKKLLTSYLLAIPTISVVYGAFSVVPILLIWVYVAWLVVLVGAQITACLGLLRSGTRGAGS